MSEFQKSKINLTAVYKDGDILRQDAPTPARVTVKDIPESGKFKELNLRMVVEAKIAEELLEGLVAGDVSLSIEQMLTPLERNA